MAADNCSRKGSLPLSCTNNIPQLHKNMNHKPYMWIGEEHDFHVKDYATSELKQNYSEGITQVTQILPPAEIQSSQNLLVKISPLIIPAIVILDWSGLLEYLR